MLLTWDVEEFDWRLLGGRKLPPAEQIGVTAEGVRRILPIHERHGVTATFFVTGAFATAEPGLVAAMSKAGHEVGVHGLEHGDDYATLEPVDAVDRLVRARELVETASGREATGMRTPRLRHCRAAVVRDAGFAPLSPRAVAGRGHHQGADLGFTRVEDAGLVDVDSARGFAPRSARRARVDLCSYRLALPRRSRSAPRMEQGASDLDVGG